MALQVIGAGFGRTGTLSLKHALEQLGFSKCHHMMEVFANPGQAAQFLAAAQGRAVDWDALFDGYRAMVDWPGCHFWKELMAHYPAAKVILSVRSPESWYASASETIFRAMNMSAGTQVPPEVASQREMAREIVVNQTFGGRLDDREYCIRIYEEHVARVQREVPPGRLLVFEAAQGWAPLCGFLGVPEPATPYPRINTRDEFLERILGQRAQGGAETRH